MGELTGLHRIRALLAPRSFGRFLIVGGINTLVAFGGFPLLYLLLGDRLGYLPILVFCSLFNPLFSFVMHKYATFAARGGAGVSLAKYLLFSGAAFLASWSFLAVIDGWRREWFLLGQFGFNILLTVTSFLIVRRYIFGTTTKPPASSRGD